MTRREFIESKGATCRNWQWSWSFINKKDRVIIFGEWDRNKLGNKSRILDESWSVRRGRNQPGFAQAREHLRLVEEEGFRLMTFPMVYSDARAKGGIGPATIGEFTPRLTQRKLVHVGKQWYASDNQSGPYIPEELRPKEKHVEGATVSVKVNAYERNAKARVRCLEHYGYSCMVCSFNFESVYGPLGRNYIHVHHIVPLSKVRREYTVDPIKDLVPICPNCHAMIHSADPALHLKKLKKLMKARSSGRSARRKRRAGAA